ncbi:MAG TPA: hypothetical protein VFR67_25090 [Pilimelia sp.]|nr:hypothetical protein [Pilimelia sp.]
MARYIPQTRDLDEVTEGLSMGGTTGNGLLIVERILRDRDGIWRQIIEERGLKELTLQMLASSAVSLALYGAVLGASNGWQQALSSTVKLPLLFLATLAICLPTLYLFNLVFGARLSMQQAVALIMVSITVTAVLTLAFAPISLFFLITAQSYSFFKVLNVAILLLTAIVGLRFLTTGMAALNQHQVRLAADAAEEAAIRAAKKAVAADEAAEREPAMVTAATVDNGTTAAKAVPAAALAPGTVTLEVRQHLPSRPAPTADGPRSASMTLLYIWILLFGFVGTQLAWTLRPFFGSPGMPFELFRSIDGTFYSDIIRTVGHLLGG